MITSSDYVSSGKNEDVEIPSQLLLDTQVNDSTKMDTSSGNKETYDSIAVTETHLPTPFELRMLVMGQRFQKLQSESFPLFSPPSVHSEDLDFSRVGLSNPSSTRNLLSSGISTDTDSSVNFSGPRFHKRTAADRWDRVRALVVRQKDSLKDVEKVGMKFENKQVDEEMEGAELEQYWQSSALDLPPPMPKFTPVLDDIEFNELDEDASYHSVLELPPELEAFELPPPPRYEEEFQEASGNVALTVSRVPESVLSKHQEELDNKLMEERRSTADKIRAKEVDILWRENLARERVIKLEKEAQERIAVEKMKYGQYLQHKEAELSNSFRRAREQLEQGVKAQKAAIYQKYGEYEVDQEALSRRAVVSYDNIPQPIEVRVHFLRALKTKLPKGAYVLMLSQFDRLGGRPLRYKNIACYGIGPDKPAVSKIVKHYGRYFDRNLKFEDSVYTLCPPRSALKPSYCLVFELFELESHRNQTGDRVVAWSAIPMCNEHMAVIDGKFKLPFLRGEVTPEIEHFRSMEIAMGHDLNTWLCNGYFEIRHLPRDVSYDMSTDENIIEGGSIKKELGMEYNYLTKQVKTLQYNKHKMEKAEMKKAKQLSGNVSAEEIGAVLSNPSQNSPPSKENAIRKSARSHDAADGNGGSYFDENADQTLKFDDKVNVDGLFQRKNVSIFDRTKSSGQLLTRRTSDLEAGGGANGGSTSVSHKSLDRAKSKKSSWSGWFGSKSGDGNDSDNPGNEAAVNEDDDVEVIERGYDSEDEFYMNDEQKGKLAGIEAVSDPNDKLWAASGLIDNSIIKTNTNRVMVRRNQSDGLRLDTEITSLENATKQLRKVDVVATEKRWEPLTDPREMETYTMAIASDPGARRKLLPTVISKSKLRYLYLESFGDFAPNMVGTFDFYVTVLVMIMSFWLRIYVHYVGQYFFLQVCLIYDCICVYASVHSYIILHYIVFLTPVKYLNHASYLCKIS